MCVRFDWFVSRSANQCQYQSINTYLITFHNPHVSTLSWLIFFVICWCIDSFALHKRNIHPNLKHHQWLASSPDRHHRHLPHRPPNVSIPSISWSFGMLVVPSKWMSGGSQGHSKGTARHHLSRMFNRHPYLIIIHHPTCLNLWYSNMAC